MARTVSARGMAATDEGQTLEDIQATICGLVEAGESLPKKGQFVLLEPATGKRMLAHVAEAGVESFPDGCEQHTFLISTESGSRHRVSAVVDVVTGRASPVTDSSQLGAADA